jgi:hypothetical protein
VDVSDTTGSASGTSKKIEAKNVIVTDAISISASDFQSMATSPVTLVAAQGSGWAILPLSVMACVAYGTTTQTAKVNVYITHSTTPNYWSFKTGFMHNVASDATISFQQGGLSAAATADNLPLKIQAASNFTFDATGIVYVSYQVVAI